MERKFYTNDFEELLKEKADEFRMYPSKRVWHSIYNDLHPGRKWPSLAISMVLIIALLMVGYWNNKPSATITETNLPAGTTPGSQSAAPAQSIHKNSTASTTTTPLNDVTSVAIADNKAGSNTVNVSGSQQRNNRRQRMIAGSTAAAAVINNAHNKTLADKTKPSVSGSLINTGSDALATTTANQDESINGHNAANNTAKVKAGSTSLINNAGKATGETIADHPANEEKEMNANDPAGTTGNSIAGTAAVSTADNNNPSGIANATPLTGKENKQYNNAANPTASNTKNAKSSNQLLSADDDKMWIDNYAFYNKSKRKAWQDRTSIDFYITPSMGYRRLTNEAKFNLPASSPSASSTTSLAGIDARNAVTQKPGPGFEAGAMLNYKLAKFIVVKAGLQVNYTNYAVYANELNHPVLTTLMFQDFSTGFPYLHANSSTLSNIPGVQASSIVHNQTYQLSMPIGFALKFFDNKKLQWYAGATVQPTYVFGGKAFLISADRGYYVEDASLMRHWNINTGIETYINYKFDNFTLVAGPQFRYQTLSTYYNKYTVKENLYNVGLKIGIVKNF